jgi:2,4-dienoyl-CoA reductase (NADPH2)
METWNVKAHASGIGQSVDLVPMGVSASGDGSGALELRLQHHPTGTDQVRTCDWVVCAVHQRPEDELWHALDGAPFEVHRIGDCLAPRRAHAAVIEGNRVAVAL